MSRAHYREAVTSIGSNNGLSALPGASVTVRTTGTATPTPVPLYAGPTGGSALANPLTADASGTVEFWCDTDERLDLYVTAVGQTPRTITVDVMAQQTETGPEIVSPTLSGIINATADYLKNGGLLSFGGNPATLQNLKYVPIWGANLGIGNNDLVSTAGVYVVPAGRKAVFSSTVRYYNPSGGSITCYFALKVAGVYWRVSNSNALATLASGVAGLQQSIILNAGESIAINCTAVGLNMRGAIFEFDAADTRLSMARILGLTNGDNTLLTCPAGECAMSMSGNLVSAVSGQVAIVNDSGGSLNYYVNVVPSGGTPGTTNQIWPPQAVTASSQTGLAVPAALAAGDFVNLNTSGGGAGQVAWMLYLRIPV